jgi:hypothetical protein
MRLESETTLEGRTVNGDIANLAKEAYVYGYPLVYDLSEVTKATTEPKLSWSAPANVFGHATRLAGPVDEFVSVNNDSLYSIAQCDVTAEPLVLHVPDTHDRYYVMQFVDVWTNNFAYVGRRATGTAEATYLLAGPTWAGPAPAGLPVIRAPTDVFTIVGRYAVSGAADVPAVKALQDQTWLAPLSRYPDRPDAGGRRLGDRDLAPWDRRVSDDLRFWEQFRAWMRRFPPPAADQSFVRTLAPLGLLDEASPYVSPDLALVAVLTAGAAAGQAAIEALTKAGHGEPVNGWQSALHSFDYNLDALGPGTIDAPEWKIADRTRAYAIRAAAARGGLWGNHGYEACYAGTYVDDRGEQLTGAHRYAIHFESTPPVGAFWSITMYDMPTYFLVENQIDRYSIGDRTPGRGSTPTARSTSTSRWTRPARTRRQTGCRRRRATSGR